MTDTRTPGASRISAIGAPIGNQIGEAHTKSVSQMCLRMGDVL
jgi:hypothetical protein